jgi:type IV pilus assembly protein PilF
MMPLERRPHFMSSAAAAWRAAVLVLMVGLGSTGCSQFSFVKPDASRGDFRRVAPTVDISSSDRDRSSMALILEARGHLQGGRPDQALPLAKQAVRRDAKSADAHTILGHALEQTGRAADAGAHFRRAAELSPMRGETLNNYGVWLCGQGRAADSLSWFENAARIPGYATRAGALGNAASCSRDAGDAARAEAYARLALQADANQVVALGTLARVMFDQARWFEARAFSQRRLAAAPEDVASLQLASQIEQKLGDSDAARRYVERMRKLESADGDADPGELEGR